MEEAEKIVAASNGRLRIENGHIVGKNPDGTGDVAIDLDNPLERARSTTCTTPFPIQGALAIACESESPETASLISTFAP
jgi:hypothetical protein